MANAVDEVLHFEFMARLRNPRLSLEPVEIEAAGSVRAGLSSACRRGRPRQGTARASAAAALAVPLLGTYWQYLASECCASEGSPRRGGARRRPCPAPRFRREPVSCRIAGRSASTGRSGDALRRACTPTRSRRSQGRPAMRAPSVRFPPIRRSWSSCRPSDSSSASSPSSGPRPRTRSR